MAIGIVGQKLGMTRVFQEDGTSVPVTVIAAAPNRITQIKTTETDGYNAIQVTTGTRRATRVNKPLVGHFAKANTEAGRGLWEFRLSDEDLAKLASPTKEQTAETDADTESNAVENKGTLQLGGEIRVDIFKPGQKIDVMGTSKGKGFAGVVKRHHFATQDASHGNSLSHRAPGSIGQNQTPGRVFKGKKMAGQLGNVRRTAQNLEVIQIDVERQLLLVKGSVPGAVKSDVIVRPAIKAKEKNNDN